MRILIAEDDSVSRRRLGTALQNWGYNFVEARDGTEAWRILQARDAPEIAILDWTMPGLDGIEICRLAREHAHSSPPYLILLTVRTSLPDRVTGLEAGADDYITKPFDTAELRARVQAGMRIVKLQRSLAARVRQLEGALANVKQLQGLLPICSYCKKIRNDKNYWQQVEGYIAEHTAAEFSHGICPDCFEKYARPELERKTTDSK